MDQIKIPKTYIPNHLFTLSVFEVLFDTYFGRVCLYVPAGDRSRWIVLTSTKQGLQPYRFEDYFGKTQKRDAFVQSTFDKLLKEKRPIVARFEDYLDFYTPVLSQGRCEGFLISGPFLEKCPTPEDLRRYWKNVTGVEGSELNPDFMRYVRVALDTPILDPEGVKGYGRLMELFARWITQGDDPKVAEEVEKLRREVFAPKLPHPYWVDWVIGLDKFFSKPEREKALPQWTREEMGITRFPTVVAALMPRDSQKRLGAVETLCQARAFQNECFQAARKIPETVSRFLGDYGAIVVTSAKPGLTITQARLEIREKILTLCKNLERNLHVSILAGIGSIKPENANLVQSYGEAVASLHQAVQTGKSLIFSEAGPSPRENPPASDMRLFIRALSDAMLRSSPARLAIAREKFIRHLLYTGHGQPEAPRVYLFSVLHVLLEQFERRSDLDSSAARDLGVELMGRLDSARTLPDLITAFSGALDALLRYQDKPKEASLTARLESILREINRDPGRIWRLGDLCRRAEVSTPTFLKWFRKIAGSPFGPHLRQARLTKAKDLLREGHLSLERIAQECGFSSASSFIQIFRRAYKTSPRQYQPRGK